MAYVRLTDRLASFSLVGQGISEFLRARVTSVTEEVPGRRRDTELRSARVGRRHGRRGTGRRLDRRTGPVLGGNSTARFTPYPQPSLRSAADPRASTAPFSP